MKLKLPKKINKEKEARIKHEFAMDMAAKKTKSKKMVVAYNGSIP